ncbi:hypothetical protein KRR39_14105 [Nocardioides panacis]|uniref:Uncharacterized protein n=1 Tax=Nocardioides panacis TaxID=2849501 RepID=A0A975SVI1_9ACTN|nr:hypothetical protein [Nocardioides panacis]QWZ06677.1 hypothetical protein KRR39_14105 [Nocardioides panacis]
MTWDAFHHRGDVLRDVVAEAEARRDGVLPTELPGVTEAFGDAHHLVAALQLRWHTRLAGSIERALQDQPDDLESAVVSGWRDAATGLAGVRRVLDEQRAAPASPEVGETLERAHRKEAAMLAVLAGLAYGADVAAVRVGERLEERARTTVHQAA